MEIARFGTLQALCGTMGHIAQLPERTGTGQENGFSHLSKTMRR